MLKKLASATLALCFGLCSFALCSCGVSAERQTAGASQTPANTNRAPQTPREQRVAADPDKFAIIVAGVGGEEAYAKKFSAQATELYDALTLKLGFDEKNVSLLTEGGAGGPEDGARTTSARATADEVRAAFARISKAAKAENLVFVVLIGHGSFDSQQAKFNLVGPDLTAKDYAALVGALPARRVVFVNCASSSGEFVKPLSGENRIVVTATRSGNEQNVTVFADHFIAALTEGGADSDKNGRVSVLEAFGYAAKVTADWYKQKGRLATEHALIDDNGDGVGHEDATAGDGTLAKVVYLDSKAIQQAGADTELARLLSEKQRLEEAVEKLKARKGEIKAEEYERELERLLVELAEVNQQIKARQK